MRGESKTDAKNKLFVFLNYLEERVNNKIGGISERYIKTCSNLLMRVFNLLTTDKNKSGVLKHFFTNKNRLGGFRSDIKDALGDKEEIVLENLLKVISLSNKVERRNLLVLLRRCDFEYEYLNNLFIKLKNKENNKNIQNKMSFPCREVYKEVMLDNKPLGSYEKSKRNKFLIDKKSLFVIIHTFFKIHSHVSPITNKKLDKCYILHFHNKSSTYVAFIDFINSGEVFKYR